MGVTYPGESAEYRAARDALLEREIASRRETEAIAAARRALPPGGLVAQDYAFQDLDTDGERVTVQLSELFEDADTLVTYSMMFPREPADGRPAPDSGTVALLPFLDGPCPSCTSILDQADGAVRHLGSLVPFVVIAKAPVEQLHAFARDRGWKHLRLVSAAGSTYQRDYNAEAPDGRQLPMLNVFRRDGDGIRHFWGSELFYAPTDPDQDPRHIAILEPAWSLLDITPAGRVPDDATRFTYR